MFETLLLLGFFLAGVSQLIPEGDNQNKNGQHHKTKTRQRREQTGRIGSDRYAGEKVPERRGRQQQQISRRKEQFKILKIQGNG